MAKSEPLRIPVSVDPLRRAQDCLPGDVVALDGRARTVRGVTCRWFASDVAMTFEDSPVYTQEDADRARERRSPIVVVAGRRVPTLVPLGHLLRLIRSAPGPEPERETDQAKCRTCGLTIWRDDHLSEWRHPFPPGDNHPAMASGMPLL